MPSVFVGLLHGSPRFSFAVLVVAEMMGVKAGLGWYLSWAQGWAALLEYVCSIDCHGTDACSGLITLLFRYLRDWLSWSWQRGLLRW